LYVYVLGLVIGYGVLTHFQQYFSYIVVVNFFGGGKPEYSEKTIDLSQVTDKLYVLGHGRVLHIETTLKFDKMVK
jgi:hypothetical protein